MVDSLYALTDSRSLVAPPNYCLHTGHMKDSEAARMSSDSESFLVKSSVIPPAWQAGQDNLTFVIGSSFIRKFSFLSELALIGYCNLNNSEIIRFL